MKFYGPATVSTSKVGPAAVVTAYHVVDSGAPEQPAIVRSFYVHELGLQAKGTAQFVCDLLNDLEIVVQPELPNILDGLTGNDE